MSRVQLFALAAGAACLLGCEVDLNRMLDQRKYEAYEASRSGSGAVQLSEREVRSEFGQVLAALPPRPTAYVLYFITGQDELTDESKADMRRLLDELRSRPQSDIQLIGHTDRVGKDASNDALSLQRADRVMT